MVLLPCCPQLIHCRHGPAPSCTSRCIAWPNCPGRCITCPSCPPSLPLQVILIDSAGLRQTDCPIEAEGVRRTVAAAQQAHVVVHVADAAAGFGPRAGQPQADERPADSAALPLAPHALQLWVINKADLAEPAAALATAGQLLWPAAARAAAVQQAVPEAGGAAVGTSSAQQPAAAQQDQQALLISCRTGQGIDQLLAALQQHVAALVAQGGENGMERALPTRARHRCTGWSGGSKQGRAVLRGGWAPVLEGRVNSIIVCLHPLACPQAPPV